MPSSLRSETYQQSAREHEPIRAYLINEISWYDITNIHDIRVISIKITSASEIRISSSPVHLDQISQTQTPSRMSF